MQFDGDVIVEFQRLGAYVKVSAVCATTGLEVSIVGDPSRGEAALKAAAAAKLAYVMRRRYGPDPSERDTAASGGGLLV